MNKKEKFITNIITFLFILFLSFSFLIKSVNPFIFSAPFALIFIEANIYIVIFSLLCGLLLYFKTSLALLIVLNLTSCLILFKIILVINKKRKIPKIFSYILLIFSQTIFIYLNFNSKTNIICSVLSCFSSLLFLYIYKTIFKAIKNKRLNSIYTIDEKICLFVSIISLFIGIYNINFYNFKIYYLISFIVIYFLALVLDFKYGVIISVAMGLPPALIYSNVLCLSLFLILTIVANFAAKINKYYMVILISITDLLLGVVFNVYFSYSYINLIYLLLAMLVILLIPNKIFNNLKSVFNNKNSMILEKAYSNYIYNNKNKIYFSLKNSLKNLKNFYKLNLYKTINKEDFINFLAAEIKNNNCQTCSINCNLDIKKIKDLIEFSFINKLNINNLPANFNHNCVFLQKIISEINDSILDFNQNNNTVEDKNKSLVNYIESVDNFYNILDLLEKNNINKKEYKKISNNTIINEFAYYSIIIKEAMVFENSDLVKEIYLIVRPNFTKTILASEILSNIFKQKIIFEAENNINIYGWKMLIFKTMPKFSLNFGVCQKSKQEKCGDSYAYLKNNNGNSFIALADGMGTGNLAHEKSQNVIDIITNLVNSNIDLKNLSLVLNNVLLKVNSSIFSTLDLAQINLYSGKLDLIKLSSPISIVKRQNNIEVFTAKSLPIGVLEDIQPSYIKTYLTSGDFLVICSDGVVDSLKEEGLIKLINTTPLLSAQLLAETIIEESFYLSDNIDDLTCLVIKVI